MSGQPTLLKQKLKASTEQHRQEFEKELENIVANIDKIGKTLLWVGGGLVLGYQIFKLLKAKDQPSDKGDAPVNLSPASQQKQGIAQSLVDELALYLLNIVKKKLIEFLDNHTHESTPVRDDSSAE